MKICPHCNLYSTLCCGSEMQIDVADAIQSAMYALHRVSEYDLRGTMRKVDINRIEPALQGLSELLKEHGYDPYYWNGVRAHAKKKAT